jgi:hypothetical protein
MIDMLPDDALLEIFDFYLAEDPFRENDTPPLSTVENLYIYKHRFFELDWQGSFEKTQR